MVILGSYTDEFTWLGLGLQFLLGLTGIDVACDIRDLTADVTVNRDMTSLSWYGTMLLDIVALVPVIGGVKYLDDLAAGTKSIVKNSDELIDGGKRMARAADALHDLSKKGRTVLNDMADTLRGMAKKVVKNADMLNDAKYTDELANVASDAGKRLDDLAGGGLDASFTWKLRGKTVTLNNVIVQDVSYVKRSSTELQTLRKEFNTTTRKAFLKDLGQNVEYLRNAGFLETDILKIQNGRVPDGWQVHHKLPLDDSGTNSFDNLVLIQNEPYHKVITNYQNSIAKQMKIGDARTVQWPIPNGNIYPAKH